jgi:hypothetical protein
MRSIRLTVDQSKRFFALLDEPPKPNDALRRAMERFQVVHPRPICAASHAPFLANSPASEPSTLDMSICPPAGTSPSGVAWSTTCGNT